MRPEMEGTSEPRRSQLGLMPRVVGSADAEGVKSMRGRLEATDAAALLGRESSDALSTDVGERSGTDSVVRALLGAFTSSGGSADISDNFDRGPSS